MTRQTLVVVRHGKRLDEVEALWRSTAERPWDPPLWTEGAAQVCFASLNEPRAQMMSKQS